MSRVLGDMPSRTFAERWPNLLGIGGHPAVDMPAHVVEAVTAAATRPAYAPTYGMPALREAIASSMSAELGRTIDPETEVLITVGGMQGLYLAAQTFGENCVVHAPTFFFPQVIDAAGGFCLATGGMDGRPDWEAWGVAIGPDTTMAIVNAPVNPVGYVMRPEDLDAIVAGLDGSPALLLSDEAYTGVTYDGHMHLSPASHPELAGRTLVLRSFSKTHAMAAWRVGYAVGPAKVIARMATALQWQALAIDGVAQAAALAAYTGPQEWLEAAKAELAEMRPKAIAAANATGVFCADLPEACAFIWAAVKGDEDEWSDRLARDHGITAIPGRHFHASTPHLRIPFGGRAPARQALLDELAKLADALA
ncbi:MAG: aminotransferase class I/II-fold pyridoxal phosphate-dependent enzyme [Actinobacteria bacterium]|uniref:Unannotated protein n=1 Tax=freshwater metagenome TaxID=449393 RepID=A0A6J6QA10_9ZZZZ|nr:aminotransferase class I/II-fold pyridoxal phosphate-dependent enzyme [Actinomycetota bacterium]